MLDAIKREAPIAHCPLGHPGSHLPIDALLKRVQHDDPVPGVQSVEGDGVRAVPRPAVLREAVDLADHLKNKDLMLQN